IKGAQAMDFAQFLAAFDDLVAPARAPKLVGGGFWGTTLFLHKPGPRGDHVIDSAADAWAGSDHRYGSHRLPAGISRRAGRDAHVARPEQSHDGDLHLRSPGDSRGGIGPVPGAFAIA